MEFRKYRVAQLSDTAENIRTFTLEPVDGIAMEFRAGQFVKIYDFDRKMFRPYSIASAPGRKDLEFAIKLEGGSFTTYLANLKVGDCVWVEGPLGHFYYGGEHNSAFVAGGVGIAPIISMIREVSSSDDSGQHVLFYSAKTVSDFAYFDELKKIGELNTNIKVIFTSTQCDSSDWKCETKRIDKEMITKYLPDPKNHKWYICGPLKMALGIKEILLSLGVSPDKIKFEGWG